MKINIQIEVDAAAEEVFAYIADLTNNPEWQSGVAETDWTTGPPIRVGSACEQILDDGGTVGYTITRLDPGRSLTIETTPGAAVPATITRTVQKLDVARSRVRMQLVGSVRGWRRILTPLLRRMITASITSDYRRLKKTLEPAEPSEG